MFRLIFVIILIAVASIGCGNSDQSQSTGSSTATTSSASPSSETPATSPTPKIAGVEIVDQPLDVPYVPTPNEVVARMLIMAGVNSKDFLYDLGSGDGRIVIAAARDYGTRGIGYDLNPKRIQESKENARKAGVTNRVRFILKDIFEADLTGATVVTLYLLPDVNLRLRPKLLDELRPGTRIVSHNYDMGDWKAEAVEELTVKGTKHYIYRWTVPEKNKPAK
jgi:predicted O-methyltransferase YrrM